MIKIAYDGFFHMQPGNRLSRNIAVGGYVENFGRYSPEDSYHPNGLSFLCSELAKEYDFRVMTQPYSEIALADSDILFIPNPDYPLYEGASPYRWNPEDVDAILAFAGRGGGVLLLINSFLSRNDFWEENFDHERVSLLLDRLGVKWDANFMSDDMRILPAISGGHKVGYGQGGRVLGTRLPEGLTPLLTFEGDTFGFESPVGKGRIIVIGDAGLVSNGLFCFPGFDNAAFLNGVFKRLVPAWSSRGTNRFRHLAYGHVSAATSEKGITDVHFKSLRPDAAYKVDHHYRHLVWETPERSLARSDMVTLSPIPLDVIRDARNQGTLNVRLAHVNVDSEVPGGAFEMNLTVKDTRNDQGGEVTLSGNRQQDDFTWDGVSVKPDAFARFSKPARLSTVFKLTAGFFPDGSVKSLRWNQGQILYGVNTRNDHYGYDILLASRNGVVMPESP